LQRANSNHVDIACPDTSGAIYIEHNDTDGSVGFSATDEIVLVFDGCFDLDMEMTLSITSVSQIGAIFDELEGSIEFELTPVGAGPDLTLVSSQDLQFDAQATFLDVRSINGIVSGAGVETRDAFVEKALFPASFTYAVAFAGTTELSGSTFEYETTQSFSGEIDHYPSLGLLEMSGAASAAEVLTDDEFSAYFRVDPLGADEFGADLPFYWPDIGIAQLFEVYAEEQGELPSGITDLSSRSWDLYGTVADAAVDTARNRIYFSITDRNEVAVVDMTSLLITERIPVGAGPQGLWLGADGDTLYSALSQAGAVSALDLETRSLETVVVATEVDSTKVTEVIEAAPGIVFATGEGQIGGEFTDFVYVARIDFNSGNAVSRVADGRDIATGFPYASFAVSADGTSVYVGGGSGLFELDATMADASVVMEAMGSPIETYVYAVSPDGSRLYSGDGDVIDTSNFGVVGETNRGWPYPLADGSSIAQLGSGRFLAGDIGVPLRFEFNFEFFSAATLAVEDRFAVVCELEEEVFGLLPLPGEGEWLFFGPDGICAVDIFDIANPPGDDAGNPPPDPVERLTVTSSEVALPSLARDMIYDAARGQLYFSVEPFDDILAYSVMTLDLVETYNLPEQPTRMDLAPSGNELATVLAQSDELGFLNLNTGVFESIVPASTPAVDRIRDVAYVGPDEIYAIAWLGVGAPSPDLIKLARDNSPVPIEVGSGIAGNMDELRDTADRLFVTATSPSKLYALDTTLPDAPAILEADSNAATVNGFAINPDGSSLALSGGTVYGAGDLIPRGTVDGGAVAFSGDGSEIVVSSNVGEIHFFDSTTYQETLIVETGCGQTRSEILLAMPEHNAWVILAGIDFCVVPMPGSDISTKPELKPRPMYSTSKYCDSDCVMRRHITRRLLDLRSLVERDRVRG
jgi:hypothetical protein